MTRRAVCIGTNYENTSSALAGCLNDAEAWSVELDRRGYQVTQLLGAQASRVGILGALERAVTDTHYQDRLVVQFSGHGSWQLDADGDEADGRDEVIVPDDYPTAGMVADDDLHAVFSAAGFGERVVMISDSCHSGTLHRLAAPLVRTEREYPESWTAAAYQPDLLSAYRRVRFLPPAVWIKDDSLTWAAATASQNAPARGLMRRGALVFSACQATQVTYDTVIDGRPCGLFTYVALEVLRGLPDPVTYRDWHRQVRRLLPSVDYPDVAPALDGTPTQRRWHALA